MRTILLKTTVPLLLLSAALTFSFAAQADNTTVSGKSIGLGISENIGVLSSRICAYYTSNANKVAENVKRSIINHMKKYENIANPTPTQMVRFLNRNKHYMTCGDDNAGYMVESFRHGAYDQLFNVFLFDYLLLDDESLYVDINAVSYTGGPDSNRVYYSTGAGSNRMRYSILEPELTLDYMYREWKNPENAKTTRKEIKRLITMFELYLNGKRYHQLSAQEKLAITNAAKAQNIENAP